MLVLNDRGQDKKRRVRPTLNTCGHSIKNKDQMIDVVIPESRSGRLTPVVLLILSCFGKRYAIVSGSNRFAARVNGIV
jgi:hypothetical protein